jgi:hypothetical protein
MDYFTFNSHLGLSLIIGFISASLLIIFLGFFLGNFRSKPLSDPGTFEISIFITIFFLLYWGPFLIIYPIISWLFIPDYALRANFSTHLAANSVIFFLIFIIYLIRVTYLNFKFYGVSVNSFLIPFLKKNKILLISGILQAFWILWSIFFIISDASRSKEIILARSNILFQEQQIIDNAKLKLLNFKAICISNKEYHKSFNYKSDSIALIIMKNDFTGKIINNPDLSYFFDKIENPRLTHSGAEKIMQIKCIAYVFESFKETGNKYGVVDPLFPSDFGIKAVVYQWNIKLIDIISNKTTADTILIGPVPPETIIDPKDNTQYYGIKPEAEFRKWFASLKYY